MQLEIVSPERTLLTADVESVIVPGTDGSFQMLENHAPIVSTLISGTVKISGEIEEKNWKRSQNVAKLIMMGGVRPFTENSTHYHTVDISPPWINDLRPTRKIGSHMFYRFKFREISD